MMAAALIGALVGQAEEPAAWRFTAASSSISRSAGTSTALYRDVTATDGELVVVAAEVRYDRTKDILEAVGKAMLFQEELDLKAERVRVDRRTRTISAETPGGRIELVLKPESESPWTPPPLTPRPTWPHSPVEVMDRTDAVAPKPATVPEERPEPRFRQVPTNILARSVSYRYAESVREGSLAGPIFIRQNLADGGWRVMWGQAADFRRADRTIRFPRAGNPQRLRMISSEGDDFTMDEVTFWSRPDDEGFEAVNVTGTTFLPDQSSPPR
ncbi:MAG: hypothetical protein MH204_06820 [Fimbriimonadaceae bacterium]|nr:hypothetical protein [Fimbriimonadaceae bacterium]